jgi:hypothetical protein
MGNNKDPNKKRPGEKEPGTFHFNPGNMSGKTASRRKDRPLNTSAEAQRKGLGTSREQVEQAPKGAGRKQKGCS